MSRGLDALGDRFEACFPAGAPGWRTLGREAEFPVVHDDGTAADVRDLLPLLSRAQPSLRETREGGMLVALRNDRVEYTLEVGRGTLEVVVGPAQDLHELQARHEEARAPLLAAAKARGVHVLGYGIQPVTPATASLMTPKARYGVLLETIGEPWLWFTLTASDQVHVSISRDELVGATNLCNLLAPVTVALCANSPVFGGRDCGAASAREHQMGEILADTFRHGMPGAADADARALVRRLAEQDLLVLRRGGEIRAGGGTFSHHLAKLGGPDAPEAWDDFLLHEHYIWNTARPRSAIGTLELRAACQGPLHESGASAALGAGMVCAWRELQTFLDAELGDAAWPTMRRWHGAVIRHGLAADEPVPGLIAGILDRCETALDARGRSEGRLLAPLRRRLAARENPAQAALSALADGGIRGLVAHAART
ncbi:MAG: glutamate-cysteine ligase family protein [Myxococcota bacterium]|nr:glutamate-cysteine ligase family protein [Myxococcota bacterium]